MDPPARSSPARPARRTAVSPARFSSAATNNIAHAPPLPRPVTASPPRWSVALITPRRKSRALLPHRRSSHGQDVWECFRFERRRYTASSGVYDDGCPLLQCACRVMDAAQRRAMSGSWRCWTECSGTRDGCSMEVRARWAGGGAALPMPRPSPAPRDHLAAAWPALPASTRAQGGAPLPAAS